MRVVIFGAGAVGLGFMGDLLQRSGAHQVFADVNSALVEALNRHGQYAISKADLREVTQFSVAGVEAVDSGRPESRARLAEELAVADFAITSVGARVLPLVGKQIAEIARDFPSRTRPLDILCCENHADAAALLRDSMSEILGPEQAEARFGFVNTVVARMCQTLTRADRDLPPVTPDLDQVFLVEDYDPFPVDAGALRGPVPAMAHLEAVPSGRFHAYEHRKLYAHNGVHALLAVLAKLRGYRYFAEAGADPELDAVGRQGMFAEMGAALVAAHPEHFTAEALRAFADNLYTRLVNPVFGDEVARGTRDTLRMIRPEDGRLSGAAIFVAEQGLSPRAMCLGVAAALRDNGLGAEGLEPALAPASAEVAAEIRSLVGAALEALAAAAQPGGLEAFLSP
jgi:mannitol-1-phosphate 5-dehydrogenase